MVFLIDYIAKEAKQKKNMNPDDFVCSVCHSSICIAENGNVEKEFCTMCMVRNANEHPLGDLLSY